METICTTVYQFDELSDDAKQEARDWWREGGFDYDYEWWDGVYDLAKEAAGMLGIEIENIWFSGFSSQGDGACFVGAYTYSKGWRAKLKTEFPEEHWKEIYEIGDALQAIQSKYFYQLTAYVTHCDRYYHEHSVNISIDIDQWSGIPNGCYWGVSPDDDEALADALRNFMCWIYRTLEKEYDYLNSDENVDETIRANEYTFTEDGTRFG